MALSKITYATKVALNPQPSIAEENKVTDANMNEIKSVVNNAIDQVDANTTNIGNITGTILWTNPNPTSDITTLNITLNSSNYDMILWLCKEATPLDNLISEYSIKGYGVKFNNINGNGTDRRRQIDYNSDTSYTIQSAYSQDGSNPNGALIPIYAIGYKTGLFS